jgi:hypothetical protein
MCAAQNENPSYTVHFALRVTFIISTLMIVVTSMCLKFGSVSGDASAKQMRLILSMGRVLTGQMAVIGHLELPSIISIQ